jgi:hypothetical protein
VARLHLIHDCFKMSNQACKTSQDFFFAVKVLEFTEPCIQCALRAKRRERGANSSLTSDAELPLRGVYGPRLGPGSTDKYSGSCLVQTMAIKCYVGHFEPLLFRREKCICSCAYLMLATQSDPGKKPSDLIFLKTFVLASFKKQFGTTP